MTGPSSTRRGTRTMPAPRRTSGSTRSMGRDAVPLPAPARGSREERRSGERDRPRGVDPEGERGPTDLERGAWVGTMAPDPSDVPETGRVVPGNTAERSGGDGSSALVGPATNPSTVVLPSAELPSPRPPHPGRTGGAHVMPRLPHADAGPSEGHHGTGRRGGGRKVFSRAVRGASASEARAGSDPELPEYLGGVPEGLHRLDLPLLVEDDPGHLLLRELPVGCGIGLAHG